MLNHARSWDGNKGWRNGAKPDTTGLFSGPSYMASPGKFKAAWSPKGSHSAWVLQPASGGAKGWTDWTFYCDLIGGTEREAKLPTPCLFVVTRDEWRLFYEIWEKITPSRLWGMRISDICYRKSGWRRGMLKEFGWITIRTICYSFIQVSFHYSQCRVQIGMRTPESRPVGPERPGAVTSSSRGN